MNILKITDFTNSKYAINNKSGCLFDEVTHEYQVVDYKNHQMTTQKITKDEFAGITKQYAAYLNDKDKFQNYQKAQELWNRINNYALTPEYVNSKQHINDTLVLLKYIKYYNQQLRKPTHPVMFVKLNNSFIDVELKIIQGSLKYIDDWYISVREVNQEIDKLTTMLYTLLG